MIKEIIKNYEYEMDMEDYKNKDGLPQIGSIMDNDLILQCTDISVSCLDSGNKRVKVEYTWSVVNIKTIKEGKAPYSLLCKKEKEIQDYYEENPTLAEEIDGVIHISINNSREKELIEIQSQKKTIRDKALQILIEKELGQ